MLTTTEHSRDKAGMAYVYPVLSRRAGGLSIGINLNINNACNWRCIYCQVPELTRGSALPINLQQLTNELRDFLNEVLHGDFYEREAVPTEHRKIKDIAISGNGEPTTAKELEQVIKRLESVLTEYHLLGNVNCILITNGSRVEQAYVKKSLIALSELNGQVWFKIDRATPTGIATVNQIKGSSEITLKRLQTVAELCPTFIQTCVFSYNKATPDDVETQAYLQLLETAVCWNIPIKGVLLYGVERQSLQPEANLIEKVPEVWLQDLATKIKALSITVTVTP